MLLGKKVAKTLATGKIDDQRMTLTMPGLGWISNYFFLMQCNNVRAWAQF